MPETISAGFGCKACGRRFSWKPALAGKRVKCTCGNILSVPASAPVVAARPPSVLPVAPPASSSGGGLDLSALEEASAAPAQDTGYRCPSCRGNLVPGAVGCPACGLNLRTGEKARAGTTQTGLRPTAAPHAAGPVVPGYSLRPVARATDSSDKLKILLAAGGVALMVVAVLIYKLLAGGAGLQKPMLGDDAKVLQAIKDENGQDLEEWIGDGKQRMVMGMNPDQALTTAKRLKKMGARRVIAFGGILTRTLAIELPADPEQRKALFAWSSDWNEKLSEEPPKDVGQQYIWINMHI